MASEKGGSKTDMLVKLSLVFFVCLLSFAVGTFVGKKFSDNQHKVAKFEPGHDGATTAPEMDHNSEGERGVASVHPESDEIKPGEVLSDAEVASLAAEFVGDDESDLTGHDGAKEKAGHHVENQHQQKTDVQAEHKEVTEHDKKSAAHQEPATHAPAANSSDHPKAPTAVKHDKNETPMKTAEDLAAGHSLSEQNEISHAKSNSHTARIPSSLPTQVAGSSIGKYTVQVAAKKTEAEAKKYADELKQKGMSAFYVKANVKSETWFRVSVGLFTTQKEAEAYKKELLSSNKMSSAIVQKVLE